MYKLLHTFILMNWSDESNIDYHKFLKYINNNVFYAFLIEIKFKNHIIK